MKRIFFNLIIFVLATASSSTQAEAPNVIFFIADDVSWNDYGCYGNDGVRTPTIDALADGGIRFTNAYLTASSCSPSRASIVTGRYPHNNGKAAELHLPIADRLPWLPEVLREEGYYTALSGKNHMKRVNPREAAPFDHIDNGRSDTKGASRGGEANWVTLTQERPRDKPFFFWFASNDAHRSWDNQWERAYSPKTRAEDVIVPP
ncbi:MAG: sulfatase-like hydrolase/transferase, partial [Opitutaceae bacterium]|nr:sulfatase-like hydrolase/transferase [Opitutaceae bacterium]